MDNKGGDRFWGKVQKTDTCWHWLGNKSCGYGLFSVRGIKRRAHRISYEQLRGPIPEGLSLDHLCYNRDCVNPDHLEPVTHQENMRRATEHGSFKRDITHCKVGHEFTPENTYKVSGGKRCRACFLAYQADYRARNGRSDSPKGLQGIAQPQSLSPKKESDNG